MEQTVENLCTDLVRHGLLPPDDVRKLYQRWKIENPNGGPIAQFTVWLSDNHHITEYQAGVLGRGHAESLLLGPYTIQERVGRGRMAGVYRAVHRTGQQVAIKILPPSKAKDSTILTRFQRESRMAVQLKHPNIVRTFQVGRHGPLHYMVMDYLQGETLAEVLKRRGKLQAAEAVRLVHQALLGLQHLQERNLVHRDLEPSNLMLVPPRKSHQPDTTLKSTVKILDIGVGRALYDEEIAGGNFELTNEGDVLGSPEYLSPEQARDARNVDIRSDIYSLGCVLYHCLTGEPPFTDASRVRLLVRLMTEAPRPARELDPSLPEGLQHILDWMLAKNPEERYQTPERAAKALQVYLAVGADLNPEEDPWMNDYLEWLAKDGDGAGDAPVAEVLPPKAAKEASPLPVAKKAAPMAKVPVAQPAAGTSPPLAMPVAAKTVSPTPAPPSGKAPPPPLKVALPVNAPPKPAKTADIDVEPVDEEPEKPSGVNRRDVLLVVIGGGVVAILALLVVLILLLLKN